MSMLLGDELRRSAERWRDREALVFGARSWSFRQLNGDVNRLAHAFASLGVGPGDRIAVSLSNRPELLLSYFAAQKLGAVAVLLNYSLTATELGYIAENSAPKLWLCDGRTVEAVSAVLPAAGSVQHCIHCGPGLRPASYRPSGSATPAAAPCSSAARSVSSIATCTAWN